MKEIDLDPYLSVSLGVIVFYVGRYFYKNVSFFQKYSFPPAVIGGLFFAIILMFLYQFNVAILKLDTTYQIFFMNFFFTTIGATTSFKVLKKIGSAAVIMVMITTVLLIMQNFLALFIGDVFNMPPLLSLMMGSIPMVGGHGTSFAFGSEIEKLGISDATSVGLAASTFGLLFGSLIGGPIGSFLIKRYNLKPFDSNAIEETQNDQDKVTTSNLLAKSFMLIIFSMGFGTLIATYLKKFGIVLPTYVGSMMIAAILRNLLEVYHKDDYETFYIEKLSNISLSIFLSMALVSIQLWDLIALAMPMISILMAQVIMMTLFVYFIAFRILGKTYDSAVMCAGLCGFGLGATPTAMANIGVLNERYGISYKALLVVPMVGALFIDFINSIAITVFINMHG